jgi:hypothetical protein
METPEIPMETPEPKSTKELFRRRAYIHVANELVRHSPDEVMQGLMGHLVLGVLSSPSSPSMRYEVVAHHLPVVRQGAERHYTLRVDEHGARIDRGQPE